MFGRLLGGVVSFVSFALFFGIGAWGSPSSWTQTTDADFNAGTRTNLVVFGAGAEGALRLGDEAFSYKREITLNNTGGADLTFYQVKVVLSASNFDFSKTRPDGADIRFLDPDGLTPLNYWIESWDSSGQNAVVWVRVPSIGAGSSKKILMYYGNPAAVDESNGHGTFDLFDDFMDLTSWNSSGSSISVTDGVVTLDSGSNPSIWRDFSIPSPFIAELKYQHPSRYRNRLYLTKPGLGSPTGFDYGIFDPSIYWNGYTGVNLSLDTWYVIRWENTPSSYVWRILDLNGTEILARSYGSAIGELSRLIFSGTESSQSDFKLDWVRIRKYSAVEPTVVVGPEQGSEFRSGVFVSSVFDTDRYSDFQTISWDADVPEGTTLGFQIRTADTESGLAVAAWNGPSGPSDFYTTSGSTIRAAESPRRWVQLKASFRSTGVGVTPTLRSVSIEYSTADITVSSDTVWPEGEYRLGSLTVTGGATLTIAGGSTVDASGAITLRDNATILLKGKNRSGQVEGQWAGVGVTINAANVTVESGSKISADGQGYTTGNGPGGSSDYTKGGTHGGRGSGNTSMVYGSATAPVDLGSAGGGAYGGWSAGGGAIRLNVSGVLLLDGEITADGMNAPGGNCAGGAGGSIYLNVGTIRGSGRLTADGGSGSYGGKGGGGRIAVYYWGEMELSEDQISVAAGGSGADPGTIYFTNSPVFRWVKPSSNLFHGTETLGWEGLAIDPEGVKVTIQYNGSVGGGTLASNLKPIGTIDWNTFTVPDGIYELRAVFRNRLGAVFGEAIKNVMVNNSVVWHGGMVSRNEVWSASHIHVVERDVIIPSGVKVTIEPGTVIKFAEEARIIIENGGILDALATADLPIIFTTLTDDTAGGDTNLDGDLTKPLPGYWNGFVVQGSGELNLSEFVSVRYIKTTHSGTLSNDQTWLGGYVHHVTGDVTIASGVTLTIEPGAVVKFDRFKGITVSAGGRLSAMGSVAQPVYFTSIRDDSVGGDTNKDGNSTIPQAGDWRWIHAEGGELELGHCHLSYGGGTSSGNWDSTGMIRTSGNASVTIWNSVLREAFFDGVLAWGGQVTVTNSVLTGIDRAVCAHPGSSVHVINSTLDDNRIGLLIHGGTMEVTNTIVTHSIESGIQYDFGTLASVRHSNVWAPEGSGSVNYRNTVDRTGTDGNISVDPLYKNRNQGNYRLKYRSPCIDAADGTMAPETDFMGAPRYDDPRTANTGTPTASGAYADMGPFEFVETAESSVDLVVNWVSGPTEVEVGTRVLVQWEIANRGSGWVSGPWHDTIYLLPMGAPEALKVEEVLVAHGIVLGPGETYTASAQVWVPGGTDGPYNWEVQVNSRGEVFEGQGWNNNKGRSIAQTLLRVPEITIGTAINGSFKDMDRPVYYKVRPDAGKGVVFTLSSLAWAQIYVGYGEAPTQQNYLTRSLEWKSTKATAVIDSALFEWYYLMILPRSMPSSEVSFNLTSAYVNAEFDVTGVGVPLGFLAQRGTIPIQGSGFKPGLKATLVENTYGGLWSIEADRIYYVNSTLVFATFIFGQPGSYDLVLTQESQSRTLRSAFRVKFCEGPCTSNGCSSDLCTLQKRLSTRVRMPERVRAGREFTALIEYGRDFGASIDLYAPIIMVTSPTGNKMRLHRDEEYQDWVMFQAISTDGPPGILRGKVREGSQEIYVQGKEGENRLEVWYVWENTGGAMDWDGVKAALRPSTADPVWDAVWETKVQGAYGSSVGSYVHVLSDAATLRAVRHGERTNDLLENLSAYIWDWIVELETNVSGTVFQGDEFHPLHNVLVSAVDEVTGHTGVARSTADGLVRFTNLPPGTYTLGFSGYQPRTGPRTITVTEGVPLRGLTWIVESGGRIVGRVIGLEDFDFGREGDVSIIAKNTEGYSCAGLFESDGVYRFRGLPPGTYSIEFRGQGVATASVGNIEVISGKTTYAPDLVSRRAYGAIEGTVRSAATGLGVEGVFVGILDDLENPRWAVTDAEGRYRIEEVLPGTYRVGADDGLHVSEVISGVVVKMEETTHSVDFELVTSGSLTGTVSGNTSLEGAIVYLKDGDVIVAMALTDASGNYSFTDIAPGTYTIEVDYWEYAIYRGTVVIGAGSSEVINVSLSPESRIRGVVRQSGTEEPIENVMLYLVFQDGIRIQTDMSRPDGSFGFSRLEPGQYTLMLPDGSHRQRIQISEPGMGLDVSVNLSVGGVFGSVFKSDGVTPDAEAWVSLTAEGQELVTVITDPQGRYSIPLVAPGSYRLVVISPDSYFTDPMVTVTAGLETVVPDMLPASSTLQVQFLDSHGAPPATVGSVFLMRADIPDGVDVGRWAELSPSGIATFERLVPGDYLLQVKCEGKAFLQAIVRVKAGANSVEVTLDEAGELSGEVTQSGGEAIPGMSVIVYDPTQSRLRWEAYTDDSGAYSLPTLPPGTYKVVVADRRMDVSTDRYGIVEVSAVEIRKGANTTLNVQMPAASAVISGWVGHTEENIPWGATVFAVNGDGIMVARATVDFLGNFVLDSLSGGSYEVKGEAEGYLIASVPVSVADGETRSDVVLAAQWKVDPINWGSFDFSSSWLFNNKVSNWLRNGLAKWLGEPKDTCGRLPRRPENIEKCASAWGWWRDVVYWQRAKDGFFDAWHAMWQAKQEVFWANLGNAAANLVQLLASAWQAVPRVTEGMRNLRETADIFKEYMGKAETLEETLKWKERHQFILNQIENLRKLEGLPETSSNVFQGGMGLKGLIEMFKNPSPSMNPLDLASELTGLGNNILNIIGGIGSIINWAKDIPALKDAMDFLGPFGNFLGTLSAAIQMYQDSMSMYKDLYNLQSQVEVACSRRDTAYKWVLKAMENCKEEEEHKPPIHWVPPPPQHTFIRGGSAGGTGLGSVDPNLKMTVGFGHEGFVSLTEPILYTIYFENKATATAPAQKVVVTDVLTDNLDWSTVELVEISFNKVVISVPPGLQKYETLVFVTTDPNPVRVEASLDAENGVLTWIMESIDPVTQGVPEDPLSGFLPPNNDCGGCGEGHVSFRVYPRADLSSGRTIPNEAMIIFDVNEPLTTNEVVNTIDGDEPASSIVPLPKVTVGPDFVVSWIGSDNTGGSGIAYFDVYVSVDGEDFVPWLLRTMETSATFHGEIGHSYAFFSLATDNVGNLQAFPTEAQAETRTTGLELKSVLLEEDFGGGIPESWLVAGAWSSENPCHKNIEAPFVEPWAIVDSSCQATENEILYTPVFDASLSTGVKLRMTSIFEADSDSNGVVIGSNNGGWSWNNLWIFSADEDPRWEEIDLGVLDGASEAQLGFQYVGTNGAWAIDNLRVVGEASKLRFFSPVTVLSGPKTLLLTNRDTGALSIFGLEVLDSTEFSVENDSCSGTHLAPGQSCVAEVRFSPSTEGEKKTTLNIHSSDAGFPTFEVSLEGEDVLALIHPKEGTRGTEVTIRGAGFGGKKGTIKVGGVAAKVLSWSDETIRCQLRKVALPPGTKDVVIQPKQPKGAGAMLVKDGFQISAPEVVWLDRYHGMAGDQVRVVGKFFGTKKGKVLLGGKSCKVTKWTMNPVTGNSEVVFVVPKGLSKGAQDLTLSNLVGSVKREGAFTID